MIDSPIPRPGPKQVIVKVMVAGANPKDWKYPERFGTDSSQGEDMAGIVHEVGEDVSELKASERRAFPLHAQAANSASLLIRLETA